MSSSPYNKIPAARMADVKIMDEGFQVGENYHLKKRSVSESDFLDEHDEEEEEEVIQFRNREKKAAPAAKVGRKSSGVGGGLRPSSVIVHENDELIQLAQELHMRDVWRQDVTKSSSWERQQQQKLLQQENKSRLSSSSSSKLISSKRGAAAHQPAIVTPPQSGFKGSLRRGSVNPETKNSLSTEVTPRRSSVSMAGAGGGNKGPSSKLNFGLNQLFGSSGRKSAQQHHHHQGVQHKLAKKVDRQQSTASNNDSSHLSVDYGGGESKRALFLNAGRSATGLSLFGVGSGASKRKSSIISDSKSAIRGAKSHIDLTDDLSVSSSPRNLRKMASNVSSSGSITPVNLSSTPGPSLTDLKEMSSSSTSAKQKLISFKDRSWTEIERLWRGRAKESPNIENLFKPRSSFRGTKAERSARSKTIPLEAADIVEASSKTPATSASTSSILTTRKAIDLMAPHVLSTWHLERGYPSIFPPKASLRSERMCSSSGDLLEMTKNRSSEDHFRDLIKAW